MRFAQACAVISAWAAACSLSCPRPTVLGTGLPGDKGMKCTCSQHILCFPPCVCAAGVLKFTR